jgi:cytochrome c7-like protein
MTAMTTTRLAVVFGLAVALVMVSVTVMAGTLPNLPKDMGLGQHDGSPAKVTFSHDSHVDAKRPACTGCHPATFKILKTGSSVSPAGPSADRASTATPARGVIGMTRGDSISHAAMDAGRYCGACHNDRAAFGLDKCDLCHRGQ